MVALVTAWLIFAPSLPVYAQECEPGAEALIAATLKELQSRQDPCGQSPDVVALIKEFKRCTVSTSRICATETIDRNFIEWSEDQSRRVTVHWNPSLRTELELGCGADTSWSVRRDPAASLLHELTHAVQICHGLDPADHELDAVRIENIYRRASGLCQRTRYGDLPLAASMRFVCVPGNCPCEVPATAPSLQVSAVPPSSSATGSPASDDAGDAQR